MVLPDKERGLRWMGNWDKRRGNLWRSTIALESLLREIEDDSISQLWNALKTATHREINRANALARQIDWNYGGQPYLTNLSPTAPRNGVRARQYLRDLRATWEALEHGINTWSKLLHIHAAASGQLSWSSGPLEFTDHTLALAHEIAQRNHDRVSMSYDRKEGGRTA